MAKKPKFSMRPEDSEEGGLPLSNAEIRVTGAEATTGADAPERMITGGREVEDPFLKIEYEYIGDDQPEGEPEPLFLSAGKAARIVPSDDGVNPSASGPWFIPAEDSKARGLNKNCNADHFMRSLAKPATGKLRWDSSVLEDKGYDALVGLELHVIRVPAPAIGPQDPDARERTIVVVNEILSLGKGGSKSKKKADEDEDEEEPAPKKKKAGKRAPEPDEDEDEADPIESEAETFIVKALVKAEDGIERGELTKVVFTAVSKSDNKSNIFKLLKDDDWVTDDARPWQYDSKSETLTSAE